MNNVKSLSSSLQKELEKKDIRFESEFLKSIKQLNIRTHMGRANIAKKRGHSAVTIFYVLLLLPFIKKSMTSLWSSDYFENLISAEKDTYYRFLNHERFNWRAFVYLVFARVISFIDDVPLSDKTLIADDTILKKTGKQMELASYHYDHTTKMPVLGYQCLQLGFHNGRYFFPLDASFHVSKKRPNKKRKDIDQRTNGALRRKECFNKKTEGLLVMLGRAWSHGIDASFVLFDSWFAHDKVVAEVLDIGYGVICRLKRGNVKYEYQGRKYTLKQLWKNAAKSRAVWIKELNIKAVCLTVGLPKSGNVQVLFICDGRKDWQVFLCTDLELEAAEILEYYARRWSIEVFFKDCKQLLGLGKEQSVTFDAVIACVSLVMIRYLLLVHIINKHSLPGQIGPLFNDLSDFHLKMCLANSYFETIQKIMIVSSKLIMPEYDAKYFLQILEITKHVMIKQNADVCAKL